MAERVIAVLVTYNRPELFRESLAAIEAQSRPVDGIVVVDNASDVAVSAPDARLIRLERNTGGAGGFAVGIAVAVEELDADLVWLMDDDTIPTPTALAELLAVRHQAPVRARLFGSRALWTDGRPHPMNEPRAHPFATCKQIADAAAHSALPVRSLSFVSLLLDSRAVRELGLPVADYFLWNDDFEYSARILRRYAGYFCTASIVVHKTAVFGSTDADPGPRFRNEVRNKVWMLRHSPSLAAPEWVLYGGSSLLRWMRTIARSANRPMLVDGLRTGLAEGMRAPRSNLEVLDGIEPAALAAVRAIEEGSR
jgi:GT2 family glycosyltransferase